jgi:tryptophan synthase alpha chain
MDVIGAGYLYYVSLKGVTGAGHLNAADVEAKLAEIRVNTKLPIAVGFGVKDAETAKVIGNLGDGVVVGSALISQIEANLYSPAQAKMAIIELLTAMRHAMDN